MCSVERWVLQCNNENRCTLREARSLLKTFFDMSNAELHFNALTGCRAMHFAAAKCSQNWTSFLVSIADYCKLLSPDTDVHYYIQTVNGQRVRMPYRLGTTFDAVTCHCTCCWWHKAAGRLAVARTKALHHFVALTRRCVLLAYYLKINWQLVCSIEGFGDCTAVTEAELKEGGPNHKTIAQA